uniref:Uncharacterized protein n=1 Tax=Nyssomyia neivai TaxID=330878 RepID=A0A1L8D842_9DIPT
MEEVKKEHNARKPKSRHGYGIEETTARVVAEGRYFDADETNEVQYNAHKLNNSRYCSKVRWVVSYLGAHVSFRCCHCGRCVLSRKSRISHFGALMRDLSLIWSNNPPAFCGEKQWKNLTRETKPKTLVR